jgi:ABC-type antimicrobial peptide transport system permease subunit
MVVADGVRIALAGTLVGGVAALALGRWIGPLLFQQSPYDPTVFGLTAAMLIGIATVASCVPALRAAGVDPKSVLHAD